MNHGTASADAVVDVAVVGGGLVGAAMVLGAAQAGLSTTWFTGRASLPSTPAAGERDLRVYALGPATQRFLERLRIWPQLDAARLAPVFDMRVYGDGAARSALHFGAYEAATERLATIVEHRELARVLDAATAFFPGIERVDAQATGFAVADDRVAIATARGAHAARLVVAADGAASATRTALGIAITSRPYGQRAIVGNFAVARAPAGAAFQWFTDEGIVALLPLAPAADGRFAVSLVWSAPDAVADALLAATPDEVAARLSTLCASHPDAALGPVVPLGPLAAVPLTLQWAERLVAPRAALVGDAAHVVHPLAGQGLNLGFGDVEALLDVLVARPSFRDCGDVALLRRYERARAEPVLAMRRMTDGLARLFASQHRGVAGLRGAGLRAVDRAAPLKRLLVRSAAGR